MKICVIAPAVLPILGKDQKYGGIETAVSVTVEEMVRRGHEVYLFASGDSITSAKLVATTEKALGQSVSFDQEKAYNKKAYKLAIGLKPDVIWDNTYAIHAHDLRKNKSKYLYKADIVLRTEYLIDTGDIPVVQTLHGPAKDYLPKLMHDLSVSGHYFVSISKDQARRYLKYLTGKQHLGTVYHTVDLDYFNVSEKPPTRNYLFWAGRYCMEKGPHIALEVAHRLGLPMVLLGKKAEPHEVAYYEKFVEPLLSKNDKTFESSLPVPEKIKLFQNAKATMMTNLWPEPFGIVLAESMACGTPVVGPALGSLSELIDSAGALVPVDDLKLDENDTEVSPSQLKYIDRIVKYMKNVDAIPASVPRKRAVYLFSPKHNVDGYEEAFGKAIYLKKNSANKT